MLCDQSRFQLSYIYAMELFSGGAYFLIFAYLPYEYNLIAHLNARKNLQNPYGITDLCHLIFW